MIVVSSGAARTVGQTGIAAAVARERHLVGDAGTRRSRRGGSRARAWLEPPRDSGADVAGRRSTGSPSRARRVRPRATATVAVATATPPTTNSMFARVADDLRMSLRCRPTESPHIVVGHTLLARVSRSFGAGRSTRRRRRSAPSTPIATADLARRGPRGVVAMLDHRTRGDAGRRLCVRHRRDVDRRCVVRRRFRRGDRQRLVAVQRRDRDLALAAGPTATRRASTACSPAPRR